MWYSLTNKSKWGISEILKVVNRDRIIEEYQEEGWNAFHYNGFGEELDPDMWIVGGIILEPSESPY